MLRIPSTVTGTLLAIGKIAPPGLATIGGLWVAIGPTVLVWVTVVPFTFVTRGVPCELGSLMGFTAGKLGLVAAGVCIGPNDGVALVGWFTTGLRLVAAGVCTGPNDGVAAMAAISLIVPQIQMYIQIPIKISKSQLNSKFAPRRKI